MHMLFILTSQMYISTKLVIFRDIVTVHEMSVVHILNRKPVILNQVFCDFPLSLLVNYGPVS
jgi:hypothetical protein